MAFRQAVYLAGDSFPLDRYVEVALRDRLASAFSDWVGRQDMLSLTGEATFQGSIPRRLALLEQHVQPQAILIGRSSGARVVTMFAMRRPVAGVICLGYPFHSPGKRMDPNRFERLAQIAVPTLILQGVDDSYGGSNIIKDYVMSSTVSIRCLDCGHAFQLPPSEWEKIGQFILVFCGRVFEHPAAWV